ncbi:MAG: caspase family protein [Winogradskyella sp.]|uniref:caspase family protein n=1 Tax=Winogradskyella sp. TaxID=1883156 RepID=UPI0025D7B348|nr:caspase family protein [Winogradskyella sp.]NRB61094.1 caspase family protein [Winogradskyella sp.]
MILKLLTVRQLKTILILVSLLNCINAYAEKYALIIAIGNYPEESDWNKINSDNDVLLIKETLLNQKFKKQNISVLMNEFATKKGITDALEKLHEQINTGDFIIIHYSGHGQQIFDDNGDEIDNKDESLVPYNAFSEFTPDVYEGENHIRDDELERMILKFRKKLGPNGQLLILLDSCHSGSATRGGKAHGGHSTFAPPGWKPGKNNDNKGSGLIEPIKVTSEAAPFVMISGASADELNYEYKGYGSLSFAFSKAMNDLGSDVTYRKLFSAISAKMNVISPNQTPTAEGDLDFKLFGGEYVKQQVYFPIDKITRADIIKINAGKLQNLFDGTTVVILPAGTSKVEDKDIITKGTITKARFNESIIKLDTPLKTTNEKELWVFIHQPTFGDISLNIFFDPSLKSKDIKEEVKGFLESKKIGQIVDSDLDANLIIAEDKDLVSILTVSGQNSEINGDESIYSQAENGGKYDFKDFTNAIFNYAQGSYLKNLNLKNNDYEFEFRLLPAKYNPEIDEVEYLEANAFIDEAGKFKVNTDDDVVFLEVTNKSDQPLYFSIIEINTKGEIAPFMPNDDCTLNDNERRIMPGKTMIFENCYYQFGDPYETLVLKGFATPKPINFKPTVLSRGKKAGTRGSGETNPLENFISETYSQTRGRSIRTKRSKRIDGYSTEFVYEIVRSKE